ncbi:MAG: hypothetical protein KDE48_05000 [Anaerolineales bacterium]|nr:hypothetical protein [Anaerolineales bacterium]
MTTDFIIVIVLFITSSFPGILSKFSEIRQILIIGKEIRRQRHNIDRRKHLICTGRSLFAKSEHYDCFTDLSGKKRTVAAVIKFL